MPQPTLSYARALALLAVVVLAWGFNWPVTKTIVREMSPLWSTTARAAIATIALAVLLWWRGEFIIPKRGDVPVVLSTSLLHMTAYSALVAAGIQYLPAGRAIVLGYTTPIWVTLGARVFLGEAISLGRAIGAGLGLAGLLLIFSPASLDWRDKAAMIGSGIITLAAICWAANIVYVRAHRWISTPFQLVFWQLLLSTLVLAGTAMLVDGMPHVAWTPRLVALLSFSGLICTALAHWAMLVVNRSLPAVTTSLGLLATPAIGILCGVAFLGEAFEPSLSMALVLIAGGIATGILSDRPRSR
jgi:drug/metabolite transporter (DMT)-like permease